MQLVELKVWKLACGVLKLRIPEDVLSMR